MQFTILKINTENYHEFDDMIYWRIKGIERTINEKEINRKNQIIPDELKNTNHHVFVIKTDNKHVAWISLIYLPKIGRPNINGYIYVDELWVAKSHRRMGYAKLLMEKADELCLEMQTVGVRLGVNIDNPAALKLYEKCGYQSTGQAFTMEKRKQ